MELTEHKERFAEVAEKIREALLPLHKDGFEINVTPLKDHRAFRVDFSHPEAVEQKGVVTAEKNYSFIFGIPYFDEVEAQMALDPNGGLTNG